MIVALQMTPNLLKQVKRTVKTVRIAGDSRLEDRKFMPAGAVLRSCEMTFDLRQARPFGKEEAMRTAGILRAARVETQNAISIVLSNKKNDTGGHVTRTAFENLRAFSSVMSSSTSTDRPSQASQNTTEVLQNASFSRSDGSSVPPDHVVTASDLLLGAYDPAKLHPLAELGDKLDYLLLDDDKTNELPGAGTAIPSRGWGDDLCYGTGTMYLTGA
jgi:hypothetical protein